jgi:hypothetical protein
MALALSIAAPAAAEETLGEALAGGEFKALLRYNAMYRDSNLHVLQDSSEPIPKDTRTQQYSAFGGYFGYETASWRNWSVGATIYGSFPIGNNPADRRGLGGLYEADGGQEGYAVLGEAYLRYENGAHRLSAGRREMPAYRMVSLSDIRMTPVTHTGVTYDYTGSRGFGAHLGWIRKMKERNETSFVDMAEGARLKESQDGKQLVRGDYDPGDFDETGAYIGDGKTMAMGGVALERGPFSFEAWNYYVKDFVNSVYLYGDYRFEPRAGPFAYSLAAQYTRQFEVGRHIAGSIDTWHWGLLARAESPSSVLFIGYNEVAYNEDSYDGGTLFVRWGTPQMFNSFQVQDSELAGTKSWGAGFQYDFGLNGLVRGLVMRWRYAQYDLPDELYLTDARQDRNEATFDLRYSFVQDAGFGIFTKLRGLSLQFRLAYNNYRTDYDFEAYKAIHGYTFETATDDFWDSRLYLEYLF